MEQNAAALVRFKPGITKGVTSFVGMVVTNVMTPSGLKNNDNVLVIDDPELFFTLGNSTESWVVSDEAVHRENHRPKAFFSEKDDAGEKLQELFSKPFHLEAMLAEISEHSYRRSAGEILYFTDEYIRNDSLAPASIGTFRLTDSSTR